MKASSCIEGCYGAEGWLRHNQVPGQGGTRCWCWLRHIHQQICSAIAKPMGKDIYARHSACVSGIWRLDSFSEPENARTRTCSAELFYLQHLRSRAAAAAGSRGGCTSHSNIVGAEWPEAFTWITGLPKATMQIMLQTVSLILCHCVA